MKNLLSIILILTMTFSLISSAQDTTNDLTNKISNEKNIPIDTILNSNEYTNINYTAENIDGNYDLHLNIQGSDENIYIDKERWIVSACCEKMSVSYAFDNDIYTKYHSYYDVIDSTTAAPGVLPHYIDMTFPDKRTVNGIKYTARQDNQYSGLLYYYSIYIKEDSDSDWVLHSSGNFDRREVNMVENIYFDTVDCTSIRLQWDEKNSKYGTHATAGEIDVFYIGGELSINNTSYKFANDYGESTDLYIDSHNSEKYSTITNTNSDWIITASSTNTNSNGVEVEKAEYAIDNITSTIWHSLINPQEYCPHWLMIELPKETWLGALNYVPRQEKTAGICTGYEVHVSTDGKNFTKVSEGTWENNAETKTAYFDKIVLAKYVKFVMTDSVREFGSASEIYFLGPTINSLNIQNNSDNAVNINNIKLRTNITINSNFTNESGYISISDGGILYNGNTNGNVFCAYYQNGLLQGVEVIPFKELEERHFDFDITPHYLQTFLLDENLNPLSSTLYEYTFD